MNIRNKRTEIQIRLNDINNELKYSKCLTDDQRYALNDEKDDLDIKLSVLEDEITDQDKDIQKMYEAIDNFNGDWSKDIRQKYDLSSFAEVLDIIEL